MAGATGPGATTNNFAESGAHVGAQANAIFGDVYQYAPDDPPEKKFQVGVNYLNGGSALKARQLIEEAIAHDYQSSEVWFYLLLAVLSGRTSYQFSDQDIDQIKKAKSSRHCCATDNWGRASQVIFRFFDSLSSKEIDRSLLTDFERLGPEQRNLILRHLDVFLKGPIENHMWKHERDRASQVRDGNDRVKRVWMFFVPQPAQPRIRRPMQPAITAGQRTVAGLTALVLAAAVGYTGWDLARHGSLVGLVALIASFASGWAVVVNGIQHQFLTARLRAKEAEHRGMRNVANDNPGKFAREVDQLFGHYFATCVPKDTDRSAWISGTAGIRASLQAEMVDCYRGSRISSAEVRWLIRHHVYEVRRSWQAGTFGGHRTQFRPRPKQEASIAAGCVALLAGSAGAIDLMIAPPAVKAVVIIVAVLSGWWGAAAWLHIIVRRKQYAGECVDYDVRRQGCIRELEKWREELSASPTDAEMAEWLDADQKVLMDEALRHYKLTRSEVIAHAFIAEAVPGCKHRRVPGGPMRYSRYQIHVFLLTSEGVRQVIFNLNFRYGWHPIIRRTNYRYEAIAAVHFTQVPRSLELQLVGGQKIDIQLAEPDEDIQPGIRGAPSDDAPDPLLGVNLTPASLTNTIHVLEGIAAEGKEWVKRERFQSRPHPESFVSSGAGQHWGEDDLAPA